MPSRPAVTPGEEAGAHPPVIAKVSKRLLWFLFICFVFSFLDRINIGFAGLTMMDDLGLSSTQFGMATTIFYLAYIACGIPSNMVLAKLGARRWIGSLMIAWGVASTATLFAHDAASLYWLRALVGITEAGFLPGVLLYMTFWFPAAYRARANALFMIAMPFTAGFGSVLSGAILGLDGHWGLAGWQWLFLLEGLPSVVLGLAVYGYLDDKPRQARWLSDDEKLQLAELLERDRQAPSPHAHWGRELLSPAVTAVLSGVLLPGQHPGDDRRLDAVDRQELQRWSEQYADRIVVGNSSDMHHCGHDPLGPTLGPDPGAALAPGVADADGCRGLVLYGLVERADRTTGRDLHGGDGFLYGHVDFLDLAGSLVEFSSPGSGYRGDQRRG